MNCRICNKAIVLVPSARERAAKFGGTPEFYTRLFTTHGSCQVAQRSLDAVETMRRQQHLPTNQKEKMHDQTS